MNIPRIIVSGMSGSSGKTLLSLGLVRAWEQGGVTVQPFKKGPDYIDAAWLSLAAGRVAGNLDPFFLKEEEIRFLFQERMRQSRARTALVEGNRGLFDGRDVTGSCSTAQVAKTLKAPVLLALNCAKMTRTAAALIQGLQNFDKELAWAGVVLNNVGSARHAAMVRQALEHYTDMKVLGAVPRSPGLLHERHMGLSFDEGGDPEARHMLDALAALVRAHVNVDEVLALAHSAPPLPEAPDFRPPKRHPARRPRIGYVKDRALWFYYEENLEALARAGADLIRLSILEADPWPQLDGLYLGGGFPELFAKEISASPHLDEIRRMAAGGLPIYAECGGFMILCRELLAPGEKGDGMEAAPMAGIFSQSTRFHPRPRGLGYVEAAAERENPFHPLGLSWRGHEFHYSQIEEEARDTVLRLESGKGMAAGKGPGRDGLLANNTFAAYTHLFAPAVPHWAECFVRAACNIV